MTLFDRYVVVDWSASSTPSTGADSIWIADLGDDEPSLCNPATRSEAFEVLETALERHRGDRTLIGFDVSLGYPAGTASLFGLDRGTAWDAMWRHLAELLTDDAHNRNDRFDVAATLNRAGGCHEGPFWGAPTDAWAPALRRTKPEWFPVDEYRLAERILRSRGRHPKSCWQLFGAGSVGSQSLTLLPRLATLAERVEIWPLGTGLRVPRGDVVVVEVWPSMFPTDPATGSVLDAAQVAGTSKVLREADRSGDLGRWFVPLVSDPTSVETEEGWILGVEGDLPA